VKLKSEGYSVAPRTQREVAVRGPRDCDAVDQPAVEPARQDTLAVPGQPRTVNDLDLVARTASDDYAAGEIADLTGQLAAAAKARDDRLREADLAASALVLPQPRPRPPESAAEQQPDASTQGRALSAKLLPRPDRRKGAFSYISAHV
jgi:hypothetical protein